MELRRRPPVCVAPPTPPPPPPPSLERPAAVLERAIAELARRYDMTWKISYGGLLEGRGWGVGGMKRMAS